MTNAKHTPGPWVIAGHYIGTLGVNVATVGYASGAGHANARLIAAAPDLLAALEAILPDLVCTIQEVIDNDGSSLWVAEAQARAATARAAIAKATGQPAP